MEQMILFLDDDPLRASLAQQRMKPEDAARTIWCATAEEAIVTLNDYYMRLDEVHLDHDLGGQRYVHSKREDCGMEVVRHLERMARKEPQKFEYLFGTTFRVHTWNIPAGEIMTERLIKLGLITIFRPFGV